MSETQTEVTTDDGPRGPGTVNLNRYCGDNEGRYDYTRPFAQRGHTYATDGRIAVRIPSPSLEDSARNVPTIHDMKGWDRTYFDHELFMWPEATYEFAEHVQEDGDGSEYTTFEPKPDRPVTIDGCLVSPKYHYLISLLPGVRFLTEPDPDRKMIYFRFDGGGAGLICTIRKM